jgi:dTDP-glucose 4,6-dehydratase
MAKRFLVTGGAGFIGSAVVRRLIEVTSAEVLVVDKLTYAGNLELLAPAASSPRYRFARADIVEPATMRRLSRSSRRTW